MIHYAKKLFPRHVPGEDGTTGELDDWLAAWPLVWRVYLAGSVTLTERAGGPRPQFEIKY